VTDEPHDSPAPARLAPEPVVGPVTLRIADGPLLAPVLSRVVSMILARADCPVDRLDDALILCDALAAHAPAHVRDGHVCFQLDAQTQTAAIELRVAELGPGGASGLIADAQLPDVGNVIERFSDSRQIEPSGDGTGEELVLSLRFG
jgi:hypothetical protein